MAYVGKISLTGGITQANDNDFALINASAVYIDDLTRLSDFIITINTSISNINNDISGIPQLRTDIDNNIAETNKLKGYLEYTAFEVMPNAVQLSTAYIGPGNRNYKVPVPICTTHVMVLRSSHDQNQQNVVVDWGDGTVITLKDADVQTTSIIDYTTSGIYKKIDQQTGSYTYTFVHVYDVSIEQVAKKFIVKVHGTTYWGIHNNVENYNLISRVMDLDLPIASCCVEVSGFAKEAKRLQVVQLPNQYKISHLMSISGLFRDCVNLEKVSGFMSTYLPMSVYTSTNVFRDCENLTDTDLPMTQTSLTQMWNSSFYQGCSKLQVKVSSLLPAVGFIGKIIEMDKVFYGCEQLTLDNEDLEDVANKLWNNTNVIWKKTSECFVGCSADVRSKVPDTWGGTKLTKLYNPLKPGDEGYDPSHPDAVPPVDISDLDKLTEVAEDVIEFLEIDPSLIDLSTDDGLYYAAYYCLENLKLNCILRKDDDLYIAFRLICRKLGATTVII